MLLSPVTAQQLSLPIQRTENPFDFFSMNICIVYCLPCSWLHKHVCVLETAQHKTRWQHGFAPTSSLITCFTHSTVHSNQLISSNICDDPFGQWWWWPFIIVAKVKIAALCLKLKEKKGRRNTPRKICDLQFIRPSDHVLDNNGNWYNSNGHQPCPMNWRNCASPCEPNILTHSTP